MTLWHNKYGRKPGQRRTKAYSLDVRNIRALEVYAYNSRRSRSEVIDEAIEKLIAASGDAEALSCLKEKK